MVTRNVLVTGASGFIGRAMLPELVANGWQVIAATRHRSSATISHPAITWQEADLHDGATIAEICRHYRPTHLLHLAWTTVHGLYWEAEENLAWVASSIALLRAFRAFGGVRAVIAGTCAEYDWTYGYCREDVTPLVPHTLYGTSKDALRILAQHYYGGPEGPGFAWGRIFSPYGPNENAARLIPSVINSVLNGQPVRCTAGTQYRDFLHVTDVASAFRVLLESDQNGCFNIASGQPVRIRDLVNAVTSSMNSETRAIFGALPVHTDDPPLLVGDCSRLRQLGWQPAINLERGLSKTIDWWRMRHSIPDKDPDEST